MPIGNVISQKMAIEITIRVRYKKFLPAASILMNVAGLVAHQVSGIFCLLYPESRSAIHGHFMRDQL
jgi:hypothetical protein